MVCIKKGVVLIAKKKEAIDKELFSEDTLLAIELLIENIRKKHNVSYEKCLDIINKRINNKKSILIPCSIFKQRTLGILEVITKYLKEHHSLSYKEISVLLNRNERTIWATYNATKKKNKEKFNIKESKVNVPVSIFTNRNLGPLEVLTTHLKDDHNLSYHDIAILLNRDDRTIWTAYNRSLNKK